jgi:hypothetical protein
VPRQLTSGKERWLRLIKERWNYPSATTVRGHYAQGSFRHSRHRAGRTGDRFICAASAAPQPVCLSARGFDAVPLPGQQDLSIRAFALIRCPRRVLLDREIRGGERCCVVRRPAIASPQSMHGGTSMGKTRLAISAIALGLAIGSTGVASAAPRAVGECSPAFVA